MKIHYSVPMGVNPIVSSRPLLSTPQNGKVALDEKLLELWRFADGRELEEITAGFDRFETSVDMIRTGLACLTEAGLLNRSSPFSHVQPIFSVTGKLVSVIIIAYNGKDWLSECLPSLMAQTYSPVEVIVVDNASTVPVEGWIQDNFPNVRVVTLDEPYSIPAANNRGVAKAEGDYFLILNQDTRLEPDAIAEMVATMGSDPRCVEVAPKLRFYWAPSFLNGIGNRVLVDSWGTDNAIGHLDLGQFDHFREVPSACTAAALISRSGWEKMGGMDEKFPMYYDDPEWSYRARIFGYKVLAASKAVVYHAFGGRIPKGEAEPLLPSKLKNVVYGRLRFTLKLLREMRGRLLRNYLLEDCKRFLQAIWKRDWPTAQAYTKAWAGILRDLVEIRRENKSIQQQRTISDEQLFGLQANYPDAATRDNLPELTWERVTQQYYPLLRTGMTRQLPEFAAPFRFGKSQERPTLLIVSHDVVNENMGGPGSRYLQIAKALHEEIRITLAIPSETHLEVDGINIVEYSETNPASLEVLVENHDIALISGYMPVKYPFLWNTCTRLVVDLYDPFFLENIYYYLDQPVQDQLKMNNLAIETANRLMRMGDFFLCGTERQRDFWMGMLAANGRVNPLTFTDDPGLHSLIDILGVGFPRNRPESHTVVRGVMVPENAKIVVWGGGIWNWLDPLSLISAWPEVLKKHPDARLVFLGTRYPNPVVPLHKMARETIELAAKIGEKDRTVFFIEWLSYLDHQALLRESDIGVTFQPAHIEAHFSIRTRVIDYFWSNLPALVSEGDVTAEWIRQYGVGRVVPVSDPDAIALALNDMLDIPKQAYAQAFEAIQERFAWDNIILPLRDYCLYGKYAPDRIRQRNSVNEAQAPNAAKRERFRSIKRAKEIIQKEGFRALIRRGIRHLIWLATRE
jgi:GT2 family glycosyltransferase/glycosyltransferase involved in cell wall biosynthesis